MAESVELLATLLEHHFPGGRIARAYSGAEALALLERESFDLVLLDARMPDLDGFDTCRRIKAEPRTAGLPVLMVSAVMLDAKDRASGLRCGAEGYLCKPFEQEEFVATVQALLRLKRDEDTLRANEQNLQVALDRRTAELRDTEHRFRAIFEASPDAMFVENETGHVLDANPAACALHGLTHDQLVGRHVTELVPPGHREAVARDFPRWFSGELKIYEGFSYNRDGRVVPVEIKASRIVHGDKPAILLMVRDTTERHRVEDRQSATVQGLRAIVDIADDLIATADLDLLYRRAVELARERLGLERAAIFLADGGYVRGTFGTDMRGETSDERTHRMPIDETWRERFRLRAPHEPRWSLSLEHLQDWEDGAMRPRGQGWVAITPIQTARHAVGVFCNDSALTHVPFDPVKQEIVAVYCSLLANIIERKTAESERTRLAMAVEQSAESVMIADVNGTIRYVNPAFERITGYARAEVLGMNPRVLKSGRHGADFYERMWSRLRRGEVWMGRLTNPRKDGTVYEAESTISPIRDAKGEITGYLAVSQDVTRAAQMENELRQAQKMDSIGRLAGGIAHDFNNLLTGILGFARIVLEELPADHVVRPDVEEILRAGERASKLTRQLLAFGHRQVIQIQPLDLNAVLVNMDQILRRTLGEHIELVTAPGTGLRTVEADPGLMEQVIMNLAVNARDAMPRGGRLELRTGNVDLEESATPRHVDARPGPYVQLVVADNGVGMSEAVRQQAFEPFFTTKEKGKGLGLGLSTVYGIVKQCRGFIELDSREGEGTELRIYLPAVDVRPLDIEPTLASAPTGGDETVLVVEDEATVRRLTVRSLTALGYRVLEARNGDEALHLVQKLQEPLDLVLTDVIMPHMGGPELVENLRRLRPGIRVLYMSGFTEDMRMEGIHVANAASLILKPFTPEALATEVRRVLDGQ
jgi:PAS domain S-box-containing protein